jgi:hypothetical protein
MPPLGLGISLRRAALGLNLPLSSLALIPAPCSARCSLSSPAFMPSGPGAPPLRSTEHSAVSQLAASTACSIVVVASCIAVLFPGGRVVSAFRPHHRPSGRFASVPSALRSLRLSPAIVTTTASADSCRALAPQVSLSKHMHCPHAPSGST